jgi:uncharacterized protein
MLTTEQRRTLVDAARRAIVEQVSRQPRAPLGGRPAALLLEATGVFVTVKVDGRLRGCLGRIESRDLLSDVVQCAADAASEDPRFKPVTPEELDRVSIDLSVLGPLELLDPPDPRSVTIGTHGLVVEHGRCRGLLLPQVAIEWSWTAEQFLCQTCIKAGLAPDAWKSGATVYRFDAQVFQD